MILAEEQGAAPENQVSLFSVMANTLNGVEEKRGDLPGVIAVLSLFNLFSILNLVQEQGLTAAKMGGFLSGKQDLIGAMMNMLAGGGKAGPEMMLNLLQSMTGKKLNPQFLSSLLSMASEFSKAASSQEGGESKPKTEPTQEKRLGRGAF